MRGSEGGDLKVSRKGDLKRIQIKMNEINKKCMMTRKTGRVYIFLYILCFNLVTIKFEFKKK
jgi:hypothetical protein